MSITPQAIKDQEFQVRFRGYDAIEVKAYLELVAEEFFELHELRRKQEEEYNELNSQYQTLLQDKENLENEVKNRDESNEASERESHDKQEKIDELLSKIEEFEATVAAGEQEKTELTEEIEGFKDRLQAEQDAVSAANSEAEKLQNQIDMLDKQLTGLQQEEVDFKSTLLVAQKFANDLRKKTEEEAAQMLAEAKEEAEAYRRQVEEELAGLPPQIEELRQKKTQVRDELKKVLKTYLVELENLGEGSQSAESRSQGGAMDNDEELSDLFQSITLPENGEAESGELGRLDADRS